MKPFEKVLKFGDTGELVSDLQTRLNDLQFNECLIGGAIFDELKTDGNFGEITKGCLTEFQLKVLQTIDDSGIEEIKLLKEQHQITVGEFDYYTWYVMNKFEDLCSQYKIECYPNDYSYIEEPPEEIKDPEEVTDPLLTVDNLSKILITKRSVIETYLQPLILTCKEYNINTPLRKAHFISQVAHESCSFKYQEEIASGRAYEGRRDLGNVHQGDGVKFKGRGMIQLTGRANYISYGAYKKIDFTINPGLVATPQYCVDVAGWYWMTRNLNKYADKDDVRGVTLRINGGYNGLSDRMSYLAKAKQVFGVK